MLLQQLTQSYPLVLGHRGAPRVAAENTIRAFREATRAGADGVELDVQISADGVPVVIHDATLDRTTDAFGAVSTLAAAALAAVDAGDGEGVPTLTDALNWARAEHRWVNIEIKAGDCADSVVAVVEEVGVAERTIISSFEAATVARVGELRTDWHRFLLTETWDAAVLATVRRSGATGVCLENQAAKPEALNALREENLPVVVWTVDEADRIRDLLLAEVAAIISNDPGLAVAVRTEWLEARAG